MKRTLHRLNKCLLSSKLIRAKGFVQFKIIVLRMASDSVLQLQFYRLSSPYVWALNINYFEVSADGSVNLLVNLHLNCCSISFERRRQHNIDTFNEGGSIRSCFLMKTQDRSLKRVSRFILSDCLFKSRKSDNAIEGELIENTSKRKCFIYFFFSQLSPTDESKSNWIRDHWDKSAVRRLLRW